jgi:hypothetical protein
MKTGTGTGTYPGKEAAKVETKCMELVKKLQN